MTELKLRPSATCRTAILRAATIGTNTVGVQAPIPGSGSADYARLLSNETRGADALACRQKALAEKNLRAQIWRNGVSDENASKMAVNCHY